jgi:diguanylate cyclase (GGDEF)-like protein
MQRDFNLARYFSVFSISIIIVLTAVLSWLVYMNQRATLIDYSISIAQKYADQLIHHIDESFHDEKLDMNEFLEANSPGPYMQVMDDIADHHIHAYEDIVKLKIFNRKGNTVYSTDQSNIGIVNTSPFLKLALRGETASKLIKRLTPVTSDTSEMGKTYQIDLLEVYVPIYKQYHDGTRGRIIGAFEIYKDQTALFDLMRREFTKVPLLLIFAMSALYLFLQVVIRKADHMIREQQGEIEKYNAELEEAQDKIAESIDEVVEHESFHVRYANNHLLKCWEYKNCTKKDCPSYENSDLRCWQVAGTFCGGNVQGYFAAKYGDCRKCDVFKNAFGNRINSIGESFNNMMALLENKHNQLQLLNDRLNWLIDIDPLTQVGNRRSFQKRVENIHLLSLRYGRPYSIIMCDVDDFKFYNDLYGHQQGDYALITASNIIKSSLRKTDELFRWGGEEFVIILPEQDIESALKVSEHLRVSMQSLAIEHKASEFHILTMSFGVSSSVTENIKHLSWESVLKEADDQLYRAKSEGKNCVYPRVESAGMGSA